jgi:hypothetical protein
VTGARHKDITGVRYGRLVAVAYVERVGSAAFWSFLCDCGESVVRRATSVRQGKIASCGCLRSELRRSVMLAQVRHGAARRGATTPEYVVWRSMLARCERPRAAGYADYGGRGIRVCARWHDFELFLADMGRRPSAAHSIERRNTNGDYEPENCLWATAQEQSRNTRRNVNITHEGHTLCVADWAARLGWSKSGLRQRLRRLPTTEALIRRPKRRYACSR